MLLTGLLYFSTLPSLLRLLSRAALEAMAATGGADPSGTTVGLYDVSNFERTAPGFDFATNSSFLLDCGLAYSPGGSPGPSIDRATFLGRRGYEHLDGPWYVWCQEWD